MNAVDFYERFWTSRPNRHMGEEGLEVEPRWVLLKAALEAMPRGAPLLDAGCGSGTFSARLGGLGFRVTGTDVSATALALAAQQYARGDFQQASLERGVPFGDETFAGIWCSEVLEHLFDVHAALSELNRVLKSAGILILTTPYHGIVKNLVIALRGFDTHYNPYLSHIRFFTRRSLAACLMNAGFTVARWHGIGRGWPVWKSQFVECRKTGRPNRAPEIVG